MSRAGPAREIARRARSYMGTVLGQSANHADTSGYRGQGPLLRPCFPGTVGAGPARDFVRMTCVPGMVWAGQRSGSHPRIAPTPPAIADKVRSYARASLEL
ncbi:hypothetical protein Pssp01_16320 [Pseudomonas sp. NBRC 100443]|nr:hypothetical protein Pssp01_16320 [Pseudomonas sp. NBRC 100443]